MNRVCFCPFVIGFLLGWQPLWTLADEPATTQPASKPLQLCLAAAADHSPVYPADTFAPGKEMTAVFHLQQGESFKEISYVWIAVDVGKAAPANFEISKNTLTLGGKSSGVLRITGLKKPMPVGKYRLDVKADGQPWQSVPFSVAEPPKMPQMNNPADLMPLAPGKVWTYSFVQESGGKAKISIADAKPDADGKFRATVTMTVAGNDQDGTHIELRRNDKLVFEEWWRPMSSGLTAVKRKSADQTIVLNPAQMFLVWPLNPPETWTYQSRDNSIKQQYQLWGPMPVDGPDGPAPGYVVLTLQPAELGATSVERHFLTNVGMVREIIITAINNEMVSRQEMVLKK